MYQVPTVSQTPLNTTGSASPSAPQQASKTVSSSATDSTNNIQYVISPELYNFIGAPNGATNSSQSVQYVIRGDGQLIQQEVEVTNPNDDTAMGEETLTYLNEQIGATECDHTAIFAGILAALQINNWQTTKLTATVFQMKSRIEALFDCKMVTKFAADRPFKIDEGKIEDETDFQEESWILI